jgi:glycosyltransferase involved in cell wall biosynthesis
MLMSPTKILYMIDSVIRGGTESQLVGLINRLDRRAFSPALCTLRPSDTFIAEADCPRLELDVPRLFSPGGASKLHQFARHLRHEGIAVVQTFFQDSTLFGMAAARLARVPVRLVAFRDLGFWRTPSQEFLMRRAYPMATGFLANSQAVKNHVCARDRLDTSRFRVIYNGADTGQYRFVEHLENDVVVGIVGNIDRSVKRTDLFLRAAARVSAHHPEVTWHLVGDGDLRRECEALATYLGIRDRTVFAGRIADVPTYLQKIAIGVICSDSEGFSNAILEYMLSGCAVIATAVGGNLEAVQDGRTGLLVPAGDEGALAQAIGRLLDERAFRLALAREARTVAERNFGWDKCVADHEEYYRASLLAAGATEGAPPR